MIHKSHTKKDLIEIIEVFDFQKDIENYHEYNKDVLTTILDIHLRTIVEIKPEKEYFEFDDINDLRGYLRLPSPKPVIPVKERDIIIDKAKQLIFYCNICGFQLGYFYETIEDVIADANYIKKYGDIPTIRRALKLLNVDGKITNKIKPVITYRTQQRMDKKIQIKKDGLCTYSVRIAPKGKPFLVTFD
jgi:hypothetical protein